MDIHSRLLLRDIHIWNYKLAPKITKMIKILRFQSLVVLTDCHEHRENLLDNTYLWYTGTVITGKLVFRTSRMLSVYKWKEIKFWYLKISILIMIIKMAKLEYSYYAYRQPGENTTSSIAKSPSIKFLYFSVSSNVSKINL